MSNSANDERPLALGITLRSDQPLSRVKDYEAAVDRLISMALGRVRIFDRKISLEYNRTERIDAMRAFLLASRTNRLSIAVHDCERVRTDCPRLVSLQRQFSHALSIHRTLAPARGVYDPFCVADGSHYARRFHFDTLRGTLVLNDADGAAQLVRRFEEIWEVSQPSVTATTLGL
jgi:hypothetical protein